jgi:hypothetical protein
MRKPRITSVRVAILLAKYDRFMRCVTIIDRLCGPVVKSSWLQIRRPGFNSRHYQKKIVGLERGPLTLMSTTEELLDRKVAAPV